MGTVQKLCGISGEVERMFIRLMRYKLYCTGKICSLHNVFSSELNESEYFLFIILMLYLV